MLICCALDFMLTRHLNIGLLALCCTTLLSACLTFPGKKTLDEELQDRIDQTAVNCGAVSSTGPTGVVDRCVVAAYNGKRPFYAVYWHQGIDSVVGEALFVDPKGHIKTLYFDSAPCGGPFCGSHTKERICTDVQVKATGSSQFLSCKETLWR